MNKKGFTLIELLVSISLVSLVAYFLFQIIFVIRDIYAEKTLKSELYIETSNVTNIINKDITTKLNDDIKLINANKISDDILNIVYSDGSIMEVKIDRLSNKISYGTYSVDILKEAKIGSIKLYYNYDINDLEKNGVFYVKIPVSLEKYNQDFSIYIYSRYDSSYALIGGELTNPPINTCEYENGHTWTFDYTGSVQTFTVPCTGTYKLETWGAQGGNYNSTYRGGYGSYSVGNISFNADEEIFIVVGGQGEGACTSKTCLGGYNGGGIGAYFSGSIGNYAGGGGGATHIAKIGGTLASIGYNSFVSQSNGLIVAGGGGGGYYHTAGANTSSVGGSGGGICGEDGLDNEYNGSYFAGAKGGNQISGGAKGFRGGAGAFGQGGSGRTGCDVGDDTGCASSGGGSGLYGGGAAAHGGAGGGSGYIGNSNLTNKKMVCYNCTTSNDVDTKTESNTCHNETATVDCAKEGNGYAKITLISY